MTATKALERASAPPPGKAVRVLILIAVGVLLYLGHAAFIPVALAALIALVLSGPVEYLRELGVPRAPGALLLLLVIGGTVAGIATMLAEPAKHWVADAPHTLRVIARKMRPIEQLATRVEEQRLAATRIATAERPAPPQQAAPAGSAPAPVQLFDATVGFAIDVFSVLVLTLFLLISGPPMLARMTCALVSDLNASHVLCLIEKVRHEVGRFYVTTALINIGLGLATGIAMLLCGMPNPFLWGTVAGLLNFIPYAGPTVSFIVLATVALVSFDHLARVVTVCGCFLALTALEGNCVQPLLVGRRLQLAPLLVFLALWFGWFFWGLAGIVLATPTLVVLKVLAENSTYGTPLLQFLSPDRRVRTSGERRDAAGKSSRGRLAA
ncbi:MAG TPA: AI-2E family transporter [Steroidobacteraceae bacterium]|nr:AI-2E family transporter [Steroidobacteraceae bacterium]